MLLFKTSTAGHVLFGLLLAGLLASCKTQNLFQRSAPASPAADSSFVDAGTGYQYILRKDDKINIGVWDNDDISVGSVYGNYNSAEGYGKWLMVDANGEIAIPQVGNMRVEGLTLVQLKENIVAQLSKTILHPVVDIKVLNREVTVLGEVKNPGHIHLEKEVNNLVDIIGLAGDFDLYGNRSKVQVIRTVNNKARSITLDLTKMDQLAMNNIGIHPGDIIYVPSRSRKQWDKTAGATILPAASAVTALLLIFKTFL